MKIIEKRTVERNYGFFGNEIIVDHPKHGRLLITDGYAEDGLNGGCVRWKHGLVYQLESQDTFEYLADDMHVILAGYDTNRPILPWDGLIIEKMMENIMKFDEKVNEF